jgi:hypothetical protein
MQIEINDIDIEIEAKYNEIEYLLNQVLKIEKTIKNLEYIKEFGTGGF